MHRDLVSAGGRADAGRNAMTAEQVLRAMVITQRFDCSYDDLAFQLADSNSIRAPQPLPLERLRILRRLRIERRENGSSGARTR